MQIDSMTSLRLFYYILYSFDEVAKIIKL